MRQHAVMHLELYARFHCQHAVGPAGAVPICSWVCETKHLSHERTSLINWSSAPAGCNRGCEVRPCCHACSMAPGSLYHAAGKASC